MAEPETDWRTPFPVRRPGGRHRSARERRRRGSSPCRRTSRHRGGGFAARGGPRRIHLLTSCRFTQTWHDAHPGEGGQQEASADVGARRRSATGSGAASRCGIGGRHGAEREGPRTGVRRHAERARPRIGRPTVAEAPAPPGRGPRRARCRGPGRASARRAGVRSGMRDHPATRRGTGRHQRHRQRKRLHPGSGARVLGLGRLLPGGGRWRGAQRSRGRNVPDDVHGSIRREIRRERRARLRGCVRRVLDDRRELRRRHLHRPAPVDEPARRQRSARHDGHCRRPELLPGSAGADRVGPWGSEPGRGHRQHQLDGRVQRRLDGTERWRRDIHRARLHRVRVHVHVQRHRQREFYRDEPLDVGDAGERGGRQQDHGQRAQPLPGLHRAPVLRSVDEPDADRLGAGYHEDNLR